MKLVRESLYNFHKTGDVKSGLNIGIRAKIKAWLDEMEVENYTINDDLSIDVNEGVKLDNMDLIEIPEFIKFRKISGYFWIGGNQLNNLNFAPEEVWGFFDCSRNQLTTLIGGPHKVEGSYNCSQNRLVTLDGAPQKIIGFFECQFNLLKDLKGAPREITLSFNCSENLLNSVEGAPKKVGRDFECFRNPREISVKEVRDICYVGGNVLR